MDALFVFLRKWLVAYCLIMFAMVVDNLRSISASPEYPRFRSWGLGRKIRYVLRDRCLTVLTHPRDVGPAVLTSFLMAVVW